MKKLFPMVFVLMLAVSVYAQPGATPVMDVVLAKQTPYPAEPGGFVNVEIEIQNDGFTAANNVIVEIVPNSPFNLLPGQDAKKSFSRIPAMDSVKTTYKLQVDDVVTNDYGLDFKIYQEGSDVFQTQTVKINVQGVPDLILNFVKTEPENIEPSGTVDLTAVINNVGTGTARQVKASINSTSSEIVPLLSGGLVYVGDILPNHISTAGLRIRIDDSAEYKTYTSALKLEYKDENGTGHSKIFTVGIPVTGSINIDVIKIEPNYAKGKVKIEIANKGTTDAKSLESKLIIGNKTVGVDYTSQLKASKQTTLEFPIVYKGTGKLVINYMGPGIEKNIIEKEIVLNFQEPQQDNSGTILLAIIIIAIAIWYWRRRKKKLNKK